MLKNLNTKTIILASQSPRRQDLLSDLGITFKVITKPIEEDFPSEMNPHLIAEYLANKKSLAFHPKGEEIIITADTVVIHNNKVLNKPKNKEEAKEILSILSSSTHEVVTGVCIHQENNQFSFSELTKVQFKTLSEWEIDYYINKNILHQSSSQTIKDQLNCKYFQGYYHLDYLHSAIIVPEISNYRYSLEFLHLIGFHQH